MFLGTRAGATPEVFNTDHAECLKGATIGYGVGSEQAYKACMRTKGWTRIQGRGSQAPDLPHFRGIEGDDEFATASPEKPVTDVKELAGTWQGWVTTRSGQTRVLMVIKEDGGYEAAVGGGTLTSGNFYLDGATLRYRSSRTEGAATVSVGRTILTVTPEGSSTVTGPAVFERVK